MLLIKMVSFNPCQIHRILSIKSISPDFHSIFIYGFMVKLTFVTNKHYLKSTNVRSRPEVFCKEGVLKNFTKVIGKHPCQRLSHRCFPVNFVKFLRKPFFNRTPLVAASETTTTCNVTLWKPYFNIFLLWPVLYINRLNFSHQNSLQAVNLNFLRSNFSCKIY